MHLGERCTPFEMKDPKPFVHLQSPILNEEELISIEKSKIKSQTISSLFDIEEGVQGLENQLKAICKQSELSIKEGCSLIIISDKGINPKRLLFLLYLLLGQFIIIFLKKKSD